MASTLAVLVVVLLIVIALAFLAAIQLARRNGQPVRSVRVIFFRHLRLEAEFFRPRTAKKAHKSEN